MKSKTLLLLGLIICSFNCFSQSENLIIQDSLKTGEYLADFDMLINYIEGVDSFHEINDLLKKQSFKNEVKKIRKSVKKVKSNKDFMLLVYRTLNLIQDPHATIKHNSKGKFLKPSIPREEHKWASLSVVYYNNLWKSITQNISNYNLPIVYTRGKYRVYYPFQVNGKKIDSGFVISKVNGMKTHRFINKYYQFIPNIHYDITNNQLYYNNFYNYLRLINKGSELCFKKGKETIKIKLSGSSKITTDKKLNSLGWNFDSNLQSVKYLEYSKLLYIRMPRMANQDFYLKELDKHFDKKINKVVFDIRGNPGGLDKVWEKTLFKIVDSTRYFKKSLSFGFKNNTFTKRYIDSVLHPSLKTDKNTKIKTLPLLKDEYLVNENENSKINFSEGKTLGYRGKIYILADRYHFSSADNLLNLAMYNDDVVSVGMSSGFYTGLQFTPFEMILPNSKLVFKLGSNTDYSGVKFLKDYYHNHIDIPYEYTIQDYYRLASEDKKDNDSDLLRNPLFRIILK